MSWKHLVPIGLVVIVAAAMTAQSPVAQSPEERGLEIAEEVDQRDTGFKDQKSYPFFYKRFRAGQTGNSCPNNDHICI